MHPRQPGLTGQVGDKRAKIQVDYQCRRPHLTSMRANAAHAEQV
jgi:hypothetical protein